ncbi:reverse transcriptase domain, Reverse transcriptase zinc-binding domain protein [Artemisia annua]|uniref:Reverse transcriptase domain, Reverse transcriptase zinc-binding domain protein n=1 Tax=Artemisia annua TaxID=35608 RepID=A0A2U1QNY3_ARTAN|nr:reverse transcriptase domain, Reverse transcriptase zinc-binding domain protein [Artemisia annua]
MKPWKNHCNYSAPLAVKFKKKLQHLKISIKSWRSNVQTSDSAASVTLRNSLEVLDLKAETIPQSPNEATTHINIIKDLTALERAKLLDLQQKAKVRWVTDSDENSRFFHGMEWNRPIRSEEEVNELSGLCNLVAHLRLTLHEDKWECTVMDSRVFTVKGLRAHIIAMSDNTLSNPTRWNKILPLNINVFSWRTSNTKLPTRLNLDIRGVDLHTIRCPICDDALESEEHLFVYCELAKETWRGVAGW